MNSLLNRCRPGLAGGLDRDGSRAAELLGSGFASVEFGTVTPDPIPNDNPGVAALVARLAAIGARCAGGPLIGIGLGSDPANRSPALDWLAGFAHAAPHADYVSFNLSARARAGLLAPSRLNALVEAFAAVAHARARLAARGHAPALVVKLPLGHDATPLPAAAMAAVAAGFDGLIVVLPDAAQGRERFARLAQLARLARRRSTRTALIAVGGLRLATDVSAALAAGASGVQVHRAYAEQGAACLPVLTAGLAGGVEHRKCVCAHRLDVTVDAARAITR